MRLTRRENYDDFNENKTGFGVNSSYPLKDISLPFFKSSTTPALGSDVKAADSDVAFWEFHACWLKLMNSPENNITGFHATASQSIKERRGSDSYQRRNSRLTYDSRDHFFNPTEGTKFAISNENGWVGWR